MRPQRRVVIKADGSVLEIPLKAQRGAVVASLAAPSGQQQQPPPPKKRGIPVTANATATATPPLGSSKGSKGKRRGGGGGGGGAASATAAGAAAQKARPALEPMYDSADSFENHVIVLRGDQYRGPSAGDEDEVTLREIQSSEEVSAGKGHLREESDSDKDTVQANGHIAVSNGKPGKHRRPSGGARAQADINVERATKRAPPRAHKRKWVPGQLAWAKYARFPWWPAQVMDEREALKGNGGSPASDTDLLVRFFGTYDYGWVDPLLNLSDFDVKFVERSRIRKKALQKGVEEAVEFRTSGRLPANWEPVPKRASHKQTPSNQRNGLGESRKRKAPKISAEPVADEPQEKATPRKRKPKVLLQEADVERKPEVLQRRLRIMRQLGLAAPAGSPFIGEGMTEAVDY